MSFTARGIVDQARSYADLQNMAFISYTDELAAINEAYRSVYSKYTESAGDFWVVEEVIQVTSAMLAPNSNSQAYLVPVPDDFYKLRSISWSGSGVWIPMDPFSMSNRDHYGSVPQYRIKNDVLWIIGPSVNQIKIEYYTQPPVITMPNVNINLASEQLANQIENIGSSYYYVDSVNELFFYVYNSVRIKCEDLKTGVTSTLYVSANNVDCLFYRAGHIYFLDTVTQRIRKADTDFVSTITPTNLAPTGVLNLVVQNGFIYYATTTNTYRAALDGSGSVSQMAATSDDYQLLDAVPIYLSGGNVYVNSINSGFAASALAQDGTYIYARTSANEVYRLTVAADYSVSSTLLLEGVLQIGGAVVGTYLPIIAETAYAFSTPVNYEFTFPSVEVNELMEYICAMNFGRKQTDVSKREMLKERLDELWLQFNAVYRRDEYKNYRINNDYQNNFPGWGWGGY